MAAGTSRSSLAAPIAAIALAVVGAVGMVVSFSAAVGTALGGDPIGHLIAVFVVAAALALAAVVIAIALLVRRRHRALAAVAIVVALAPVALWLVLAIQANVGQPG